MCGFCRVNLFFKAGCFCSTTAIPHSSTQCATPILYKRNREHSEGTGRLICKCVLVWSRWVHFRHDQNASVPSWISWPSNNQSNKTWPTINHQSKDTCDDCRVTSASSGSSWYVYKQAKIVWKVLNLHRNNTLKCVSVDGQEMCPDNNLKEICQHMRVTRHIWQMKTNKWAHKRAGNKKFHWKTVRIWTLGVCAKQCFLTSEGQDLSL